MILKSATRGNIAAQLSLTKVALRFGDRVSVTFPVLGMVAFNLHGLGHHVLVGLTVPAFEVYSLERAVAQYSACHSAPRTRTENPNLLTLPVSVKLKRALISITSVS